MITWVMYDIADPKRLNRMAKICLRSGVYRVQKSVYVGQLNANQLDQLRLELEDNMDPETDSIYIFPMARDSFEKGNLLGQAFNKAMVCDEVRMWLI